MSTKELIVCQAGVQQEAGGAGELGEQEKREVLEPEGIGMPG